MYTFQGASFLFIFIGIWFQSSYAQTGGGGGGGSSTISTESQTGAASGNIALDIQGQNIADQCFKAESFRCNISSRYRTLNGTCNSLLKPWWGSFGAPHVRLTKPLYNNVRDEHRMAVDGSELPSARLLSTTFLKNNDNASDEHTRLYMIFSQLLSHDVTGNPQQQGPKCCSDSGDSVVNSTGACRPILIPADDPFYSQFNRRCMEYKQSLLVPNCSWPGGSVQLAIVNTHFIDASFLYGVEEPLASSFRAKQGGKMKIQENVPNGRQYLPLKNLSSCPFAKQKCYNSDLRVNQNIDLALIQTMFLRFHNFVCGKLLEVNPQWKDNDDLVFEEARRIVIGSYQHIVYNEWLPILIGGDVIAKLKLKPLPTGFAIGYNPDVNPSTLAEFAGAAFRTFHSMIPNFITYRTSESAPRTPTPISTFMMRPGDFLQESETYDSMLGSLLTDPQDMEDRFYGKEVTNFYTDRDVPKVGIGKFGDDIAAKDIQRGRDFGVRPYNDYREFCGLPKAIDFNGLKDTIKDPQMVDLLAKLYKNVDDIDYYIGASLEENVPGALAHPSIQCIIAEAFRRYKEGDRFFYEFEGQPGSFTPTQLTFIKSMTMSKFVCIGTDNIPSVQSSPFLPPQESKNTVVSCDSLLTSLDFSSFKE